MTGSALDVLLLVPRAQLHKVENNQQTLLIEGEFAVAICGNGANVEEMRVEASVGSFSWPLGKHLPALKAASTIYSFALEHTKDMYYILILPADTLSDVLDAVHDVLHDSCAFSTAKQVDAAYEEADKLGGSKEAAALRAAEAAGRPLPELAPAAAPAAPAAVAAGKYTLPSSGNPTADKVAAGLLWGGTMVATAVGKAAAATADKIQSYTAKQMAQAQPTDKPAAKVSPTFKKGLALAGTIASSAAYVTGKLAALVGQASYATALAIARSLPGHKKKDRQATAAASGSGELVSQEERSVLHTVGAAGLVAFVEVYDSLENAAKVVLTQSAEATSQYIGYKYGDEAGQAAAQSVPVAQDMLTATMNFSRLGARAFVSKTAKKSAKMYLKSTVAGVHIDEQAAGKRLPAFGLAKQQQQQQQQGRPAAAGGAVAAVAAMTAGAGLEGGRVGSSSNLLSSPYPAGSSAATAAGGAVAFNTAAAQQAARAGAGAGGK